MTTVPIINVVSAASTAPSPASPPSDSSQSFGQVLSREVNRNDGSDSTSSASGSAGTANSASQTNTTASTGGSNGANGTNNTGTAQGTASAGSNVKTKSKQQTTAANDATANGSAQILALVTNVQQHAANSANGTSATGNSSDSVTALGSLTTSGTAAGTDLSALAAGANAGQTLPSDSTDAVQAGKTDAALAANNALTTESTVDAKDEQLPSAPTDLSSADTKATQNALGATQTATLTANAQQPALDLAATAEKNIQTGLSALDANITASIKTEQTTQTSAPAAAVTQPVAFDLQSLGNPADNKLTPQVGSSGWDQALGQKVVWMVAGGQQSASLTLNPPDLGPMQVVLNVTNAHASATFTAAQPEVRQALEAAMPRLREMLGSAGIQLGQATVNSGNAQQQNASSQREAQQTSRVAGGSDTSDTSVAPIARATRTSSGLGLVDTFA